MLPLAAFTNGSLSCSPSWESGRVLDDNPTPPPTGLYRCDSPSLLCEASSLLARTEVTRIHGDRHVAYSMTYQRSFLLDLRVLRLYSPVRTNSLPSLLLLVTSSWSFRSSAYALAA